MWLPLSILSIWSVKALCKARFYRCYINKAYYYIYYYCCASVLDISVFFDICAVGCVGFSWKPPHPHSHTNAPIIFRWLIAWLKWNTSNSMWQFSLCSRSRGCPVCHQWSTRIRNTQPHQDTTCNTAGKGDAIYHFTALMQALGCRLISWLCQFTANQMPLTLTVSEY